MDCKPMAYVISKTVPAELQPGVLVLALALPEHYRSASSWTGILSRLADEIVDLLAGFYAELGQDEPRDQARKAERHTHAGTLFPPASVYHVPGKSERDARERVYIIRCADFVAWR
jgi:hypothetical protein